jgi:hypothetical protein
MAQLRYHNYRRALASLDEDYRLMGSIAPGVFAGWDRFEVLAGNTIRIFHDVSGRVRTNLNGTLSNPMGCIVSQQGLFIYEDAPNDVNVDFNAGTQWRVDLLVMSHAFIDSPGGASASYSVIKGATNGDSVAPPLWNYPAVSNPALQVPIAYIFVPPASVDHLGTKFQRFDPKNLGGRYNFMKDGLVNVPQLDTAMPHLNDFNHMIESGMYYTTTLNNRPTTSSNEWFLMVYRRGVNLVQIAHARTSGKAYVRGSTDTGATWQPWASLNNVDISTDITNLSNAIGNRVYTENNYLVDGESITTSLDKLDIEVKDLDDLYTAAAVSINNLSTAIGNRTYSQNNVISDGESITASLEKLDIRQGGAWTQAGIVLGSNVSNTDFYYRITGEGVVELQGSLSRTGVWPAGGHILTLPSGARPAATRTFPVGSFSFLGGPGWQIAIDSAGVITLYEYNVLSGDTSINLVDLSGVRFKT